MKTHWPWTVAILLAAFAAGRWTAPRQPAAPAGGPAGPAAEEAREWTCSMHPQIRQPKPGLCPLCGMDLIPAAGSPVATPAAEGADLTLTESARKLAEVQTVPVERRALEAEVHLVGAIAADETRVRELTLRTDGQLVRLVANYEGAAVAEGAPVAEIYSPELVAAAAEYRVAAAAAGAAGDTGLAAVARRRLELLGVPAAQVEALAKPGGGTPLLRVESPIAGVVSDLGGRQGGWMMRGQRLATVTDLSTVWAWLDAYESDLAVLREGLPAEVRADAFPGIVFTGSVAWVAPRVAVATRTVPVRILVPNPDGRLRPGLFVKATLRAPVASPAGGPPLSIPAEAPLLTGRRAMVYVARPGEEGAYEGREVELGPRAGGRYAVLSGLREGERVVTRGAVKIDGAIQLRAGRSMMALDPDAPAPARAALPADLAAAWEAAFARYLSWQAALAADRAGEARAAAGALAAPGEEPPAAGAPEPWASALAGMRAAARSGAAAADLAAARAAFEPASGAVRDLLDAFGPPAGRAAFLLFCPMAFDNRGAEWVQDAPAVRNPYFGAAMLACGEVRKEYAAAAPPAEGKTRRDE